MKHFKVDQKKYAKFEYTPYLDRHSNEIPRPKKVIFDLGDVVYLKHTNSIGVILGCVDHECEEARTNMDGMVCFGDMEFATKEHFKLKEIRVQDTLKAELGIK